MIDPIERDTREILALVDLRKIKGKKILVTGASGFLGQYIVSALSLANREFGLKCKIDAVSLSAPHSVLAALMREDDGISHKKVDLSQPFDLCGYDYIFHAGGYGQPAKFISDPAKTIAVNVLATQRLIDSSPSATFIFFSSAEIYGDIPAKLLPVKESYNGNSPLHTPRSVYAESKRLGEALVARYKDSGVNAKIVRISHVYGPGLPSSDTRVMSEFIRKALKEKEIKLLDEGKSIKTYGYISDVVSMILFVAFFGKEMVYNVGGKDSVSILDLAKKIAKATGVKCSIPTKISRMAHIGKEPAVVKLNLSKIKREMKGLKFTPFSIGLSRTIEWGIQNNT